VTDDRPSPLLDDDAAPLAPHHAAPRGWLDRLGLLVRGVLIGAAEVVPGVSGGTIALIVGVYETIIRSAGHLVRAAVGLVLLALGRGRDGAVRRHAREVRWDALVPIGIGMLAAVVIGAAVLEPVLEEYPVQARALFAGLIVASLVVPARMVGGRWTGREVAVGLLAASVAFLLTGIPPAANQDPTALVVFGAAAVAVCALVLPGVSGSFLLLTVGLYEPTLAAVNDRDLGYLGVFVLGAIFGLGAFVAGLQWLLEHRHRITLVVMTGLMAGSLRALWPWQDDDRGLLPPGESVGAVVGLFAVGLAVVLTLVLVEHRVQARAAEPQHKAPEDPQV
jgi:putative membrane protein